MNREMVEAFATSSDRGTRNAALALLRAEEPSTGLGDVVIVVRPSAASVETLEVPC